ncbi:hypothetical protein [Methanosarcina sp. WH1]|uniref:hypothetical protein n=1 Tax=Methanosarcina sp. WH1 TaxID=1434102 RepID=UPI0006983CF8|nr:hypothetical protein [Methanosarcina sp. WH1]
MFHFRMLLGPQGLQVRKPDRYKYTGIPETADPAQGIILVYGIAVTEILCGVNGIILAYFRIIIGDVEITFFSPVRSSGVLYNKGAVSRSSQI